MVFCQLFLLGVKSSLLVDLSVHITKVTHCFRKAFERGSRRVFFFDDRTFLNICVKTRNPVNLYGFPSFSNRRGKKLRGSIFSAGLRSGSVPSPLRSLCPSLQASPYPPIPPVQLLISLEPVLPFPLFQNYLLSFHTTQLIV